MGKRSAVFLTVIGISISGCCNREKISEKMGELYSPDAHVRSQAALNLARCHSEAAQAVPKLSQLLYDENVGVQSAAAYALERINTEEARAVIDRVIQQRRRK
jgi:hypothetical protein